MGRHFFFKMGSFYRVDDRSGFPQRAERTIKQWNNLIVDQRLYETRQPQDLVKGVKDNQTVPQPRPLAPDTYVGPVWTTTSADIAIGSQTIPLAAIATFQQGDKVAIMTNADGGTLFYANVVSVNSSGILIDSPLQASVSSGAQVWNYSRSFSVDG